MKKLIAILMTMIMMFSLAACGGNNNDADNDAADMTDKEYVQDKGTLVVGITDFAPMDY